MRRHLLLDVDFRRPGQPSGVLACTGEPVRFNRRSHTLLTQFAGCPTCRAVAVRIARDAARTARAADGRAEQDNLAALRRALESPHQPTTLTLGAIC
jgi:hypothetical protein